MYVHMHGTAMHLKRGCEFAGDQVGTKEGLEEGKEGMVYL